MPTVKSPTAQNQPEFQLKTKCKGRLPGEPKRLEHVQDENERLSKLIPDPSPG